MRNNRCRAQPTRRQCVTQAIVFGFALLSLTAQAREPLPPVLAKPGGDSAEWAQIDRCSYAKRSKQPLIRDEKDIVAAQLLLTIERTDAPALRKKLIGAYRRYLDCPAGLQNTEKPDKL